MSPVVTRRAFVAAVGGSVASGCATRAVQRTYAPYWLPKEAPPPAPAAMDAARAAAPTPQGVPAKCEDERPASVVVDIHCHTFNARDIPIDGFVRSLAQGMGIPAVLDPVLARVTRPFHDALVEVTKAKEALEAAPADREGVAALRAAESKRTATLAALRDKLEEFVKLYKLVESAEDGNLVPRDPVTGSAAAGKVVPILNTLCLVADTRRAIANRIADQYCHVELFTPALVDFGYWIGRDKTGEVKDADLDQPQQIVEHAKIIAAARDGQLARKNVAFHPFVAFNPRRHVHEKPRVGATILDGVKDAVENKGFVGVKLYPPSGFLPYGNENLHDLKAEGIGKKIDGALEELYAWCVAKDVPILTHASSGNSFFPDSSWRASPWGWRHVLEKYSGLRVCFGHFGHMEGVDGTTDPISCLAWGEGFLALMKEYPNVYGDISNSPAGGRGDGDRNEYQSRFLYWLCDRLANDDNKVLAHRLVFGSDWWMGAVSGDDAGFFKQIAAMVKTSMPGVTSSAAAQTFTEDFWWRNALRFLGIRDDAGKVRADSTGGRLKTYYGEKAPRWLLDTSPGPRPPG